MFVAAGPVDVVDAAGPVDAVVVVAAGPVDVVDADDLDTLAWFLLGGNFPT